MSKRHKASGCANAKDAGRCGANYFDQHDDFIVLAATRHHDALLNGHVSQTNRLSDDISQCAVAISAINQRIDQASAQLTDRLQAFKV